MKGYAKIASPLYMLISGDNASRKSKVFNLTHECQAAFKATKDLCMSAPILAFTVFSKPFKLHTDASGIRLGPVLYQEQNGVAQVIGYGS